MFYLEEYAKLWTLASSSVQPRVRSKSGISRPRTSRKQSLVDFRKELAKVLELGPEGLELLENILSSKC